MRFTLFIKKGKCETDQISNLRNGLRVQIQKDKISETECLDFLFVVRLFLTSLEVEELGKQDGANFQKAYELDIRK